MHACLQSALSLQRDDRRSARVHESASQHPRHARLAPDGNGHSSLHGVACAQFSIGERVNGCERRSKGTVGMSASASWAARSPAIWSRPDGASSATTSARPAARNWPRPASRSPRTPAPSPRRCRSSSPACRSRRRCTPPAKEIAAREAPRRIVAECSTFTIEDKEKAEKVLRAAGHVMLDCPVSGTGSQAATGDLVIYASGDSKAIAKIKPVFAGFSPQDLRRRRIRQRQPDEIRRQSAGRDQQRRVGRGDGARHEVRARSARRSSR